MQTLLPPGLMKEHTVSQTEFLGGEVTTATPVSGCKPSHEVVLKQRSSVGARFEREGGNSLIN